MTDALRVLQACQDAAQLIRGNDYCSCVNILCFYCECFYESHWPASGFTVCKKHSDANNQ